MRRSESHNENKSIIECLRISLLLASLLTFAPYEKDLFVLYEHGRLSEGSRGIFIKNPKLHVKNENLYSAHALRKPSLGFTYIWMLSCQFSDKSASQIWAQRKTNLLKIFRNFFFFNKIHYLSC